MTDREEIIKHLEMIQKIINRIGRDSFLIKGWSAAMPSVIILFFLRNGTSIDYIWLLPVFPIVFGILDAYYLCQERIFRELYDEVRKQDKTDFRMRLLEVKLKDRWYDACCSRTILIFYGIQIVLIIVLISLIGFDLSPKN